MKNLIELGNIIKSIKVKPTDLLSTSRRKSTNFNIFYDKILAGDFRTDNEAAQFFFKTDANSSNYKNLKRTLRQKIINTLFFIKPSMAHSDYERGYLYCCRNMFAAKILLFLQANTSGINLCKRILTKAIEYELTEFIVDTSRYLRLNAAVKTGSLDKFNYYNDLFKEYSEIRTAELLGEEYYAQIILPKVQKKASNQSTHLQAKQKYEDLAPFLDKYSSPFLYFITEFIHVISLMAICDYAATINVCQKAIDFFEQKPYTYKTPLRIFLHNQLICFTQLKEYEKGLKVVEKSNNLVRSGNYVWFQNKELNLILAFHSKNYQESLRIVNSAIDHKKFKALPLPSRERWFIFESYVYFLIQIGRIEIPDDNNKKFKIGKFLNSIPIYSKDKRGLNIPILIIQILFTIINSQYDKAFDRIEAIEKYCSRYLMDKNNLRSNCFIKMLLQIPICNFHKVGVERKTEKYVKKLKGASLDISQQAHEIEIIPYEDLWEFVLEHLDTKIYKRRGR